MKLKVKVKIDKKLLEACTPFDYAFDGESCFEVPDFNAPIRDGSWSIGVIVGPSGSGKSTLLKDRYGITQDFIWDANLAIASQVDYEKLSAVGLSSVPTWCRPYHVLSTGEAFRARIAALIGENTSFDEFTSTIDRNVAKSCSNALQRYVRAKGIKGVVLCSCHEDIIEWLNPDWVFNTETGQLVSGRCLRRREPIEVIIEESSWREWENFRQHHYLTASISKSSRCFVARWDGKKVGFASAIAFPCGTVKNAWRGHRTVILPDYQGLGIGVRLSDWVADRFTSDECRYFSKTAHPRMGEYRERSELWKPTTKNKKARKDYKADRKTKESKYKKYHADRVCYSHEYVGK